MRLRIPYQKYPTSYTESGFYYSASIAVSIGSPAHDSERSKRFDAIIDSGASGCLFHASIGRAIGLNIEAGERTETLGIAGETKVFLHNIWLYAPGGPIATQAAFSEELPVAGLLGMNGFFENYRVLFDPVGLCCELERLHPA